MLQLKVLQPKLFLTVLTWLPLLFHALSEYWLGRQEVKGVGEGREEVISGFHVFLWHSCPIKLLRAACLTLGPELKQF